MQVNSVESIPQYLEFMRAHPLETSALFQDLLIGVTHFFRDRDAFVALAANIPQLFAGKGKDDVVRVWVAGCAYRRGSIFDRDFALRTCGAA